jgi:hypothetical protein
MKKLAILVALALELAVCGCGASKNTSTETNTSTAGNWEAQLQGGTQQASLLNFVVAFSVTNSGPLDITGFSFFNGGACFTNGVNQSTETGNASFTTASNGNVTGTLNLTVNSVNPAGNVLSLTGNLTGTSSATTGVAGTLSNGVVVGTWSLTGGQGDPSCAVPQGTFIMCQGKNTCTAP